MPSPTKLRSRTGPRRGEIWWVRLDPALGAEIKKTRPCLVISANTLNRLRQTVVVVPLSTSPAPHPPLLVPIQCRQQSAVAVLDQVRAVSKSRFAQLVQLVTPVEMEAVAAGLREILEL